MILIGIIVFFVSLWGSFYGYYICPDWANIPMVISGILGCIIGLVLFLMGVDEI